MSQSLNPPYSSVHHSRLKFLKQQIALLGLPPTARVLDVGCYPPLIFKHLQKRYSAWGISSPHEPLKYSQVLSLNLDSDSIPLEPHSFDLILLSEVIEHLYRQIPSVLTKLHLLLKPGGRIIITTPNAVSFFTLGKVILGLNPSFPLADLSKDNPLSGSIYHRHNREYTLSEMTNLLVDAGYKIVKASTFTAYTPFRPHLKSKPLYRRLLSWLVYLLGLVFPSRRDSLFFLAAK